MTQLKKHQIVMLPTEKANKSIHTLYDNGHGQLIHTHSSSNKVIPQHLYILSDDEIKEGDWCIYVSGNITEIIQVKKPFSQDTLDSMCKKIIAATDSSLLYNTGKISSSITCGDIPVYKSLPQPSQSFIEKYIEKYNTGDPITDVMVEYNECDRHDNCDGTFNNKCTPITIKVSPKDNTITIRPVKNSWSREEVQTKCLDYFDAFCKQYTKEGAIDPLEVKKWFEENL